jgi:hypothetical protein
MTIGTGREGATLESLLIALDYTPDFSEEDMEYCLTLGFSETPDFQERAAWVMDAPEVGSFLTKQGSKLLLVNGNHDLTTLLSPLSYVAAKVADLLTVSDDVICLTYFCSRHTDDWREPRANAQGLLAQLTGQLLSQLKSKKQRDADLDLSMVTLEEQSALEDEDFSATWRAFEVVIKQLPKKTIVIVLIDGMSAYENSNRRDETCALMRKLCRLLRKLKRVDLRCMVMFPGRSCYSDRWGIDFDGKRADSLELPEHI